MILFATFTNTVSSTLQSLIPMLLPAIADKSDSCHRVCLAKVGRSTTALNSVGAAGSLSHVSRGADEHIEYVYSLEGCLKRLVRGKW